MKRSLPRTGIPAVIFLVFLLLAFQEARILSALDLARDGAVAAWWRYGVHTVLWITGAVLFNALVRVILWENIVARAIGAPVPGVLKEMTAVTVYLVTTVIIVGLVYEKSVAGFLAALGASGVVLGFALRNLFADVFTGLAINIDRTFAIGDWLEIEGGSSSTVGRIEEIGWRCTRLVTEEGTNVVLPNGMLGVEKVTNISRPIESTRMTATMNVDFSVPSERVKRVLAAALEVTLEREGFDRSRRSEVLVTDTSTVGVEYTLRYWIRPWNPLSPTVARDAVLTSALRQLRIAGISLAYPKSDVYHSEMPVRNMDGQNRSDQVTLLAGIELFDPLEKAELETVVAAMDRRVYAPGADLVRQGDDGESLFVLLEGVLDVLVDFDGRNERVARIVPGEFFGEMSLLTGEKRSATVRAVTEAVTYSIGKETLVALIEERSSLAETLSRILAERQVRTKAVRESSGKMEAAPEVEGVARQLLTRMMGFLGGSRQRPKAS